jgi:energy-converting hydrogenase Eha subunit A
VPYYQLFPVSTSSVISFGVEQLSANCRLKVYIFRVKTISGVYICMFVKYAKKLFPSNIVM